MLKPLKQARFVSAKEVMLRNGGAGGQASFVFSYNQATEQLFVLPCCGLCMHTHSRELTSKLTACSARCFINVHFSVHLQPQNKPEHRVSLGTARTHAATRTAATSQREIIGQRSNRERAQICSARGRRDVTAKRD